MAPSRHRRWAGAIVLLVAALFVLVRTRQAATTPRHEAERTPATHPLGTGDRPRPHPSAGRETVPGTRPWDAEPAIVRTDPTAAWWLYEVGTPGLPRAADVALLDAGAGEPPAATTTFRSAAHRYVVQERDRERRVSSPGAAASAFDQPAPTGTLIAQAFRCFDQRTNAPVAAILLDGRARPFGPLPAEPTRLRLPLDFAGWVVARGYGPARVRALPGVAEQFVRLRPEAIVRGRVAGASVEEGTRLLLRDHDPIDTDGTVVAELAADGTFSIATMTAGPRTVAIESSAALVDPRSAVVDISAGPQELGTIWLQPLRRLCLRFVRHGAPATHDIHVGTWFSDRATPGRWSGPSYALDDGGRLVIDRVRDAALDVRAWTRDGWLGSADGVRAEHTSPERPVVIRLEPPARLRVTVDLRGTPIPAGCRVVVHAADEPLAEARYLTAQAEELPEHRERWLPLDGRSLDLANVWPGRTRVTLISPHGTILARAEVELTPGGHAFAMLQPDTVPAVLGVRASTAHEARFAVTSEAGIVARGVADREHPATLVLPAGRYRLRDLAGDPAMRRAPVEFELEPGARAELLR